VVGKPRNWLTVCGRLVPPPAPSSAPAPFDEVPLADGGRAAPLWDGPALPPRRSSMGLGALARTGPGTVPGASAYGLPFAVLIRRNVRAASGRFETTIVPSVPGMSACSTTFDQGLEGVGDGIGPRGRAARDVDAPVRAEGQGMGGVLARAAQEGRLVEERRAPVAGPADRGDAHDADKHDLGDDGGVHSGIDGVCETDLHGARAREGASRQFAAGGRACTRRRRGNRAAPRAAWLQPDAAGKSGIELAGGGWHHGPGLDGATAWHYAS
jgi:hypothetical protein